MREDFLKRVYENMPRRIKSALSPIFVSMMVRHPEFKKTWRELEAFDRLTDKEKELVQISKLRSILSYANEYVPFYRERFLDSGIVPEEVDSLDAISALPLLEKSEAIDAGESIHSQERTLKYFRTFTGGSSGQALTVLLDRKSIYRERAFACYSYAKHGFDPLRSKTAAFWGHNKPGDYYFSPLKNEIVISPFRLHREASAAAIVRDIQSFGATFLAGYPSAIFQLVQMMEKENLMLEVEHIFYYAENYEQDRREYVDNYLGCSSSSNYGHTEHAVFASVEDDGCHFNRLYGYTELLPTDIPNEYRIVCTGFTSKKMPLIRYATDDVVQITPDGTYQILGHKKSDVVLLGKDGSEIFKGAMTLHVPQLKKIRAYQFHQTQVGKAELRIIEHAPLDDEELRHLQNYLERRTEGLLDVTIHPVTEVLTTKRGKALWAVVEIQE